MDLEDKILKFSLATDLKDDIRADEADTGSEAEDGPSLPSDHPSHDDVFERRPGPQRSGPKGVIADKRWADFQQRKRSERAVLEGAHSRQATSGGRFEEGTASLSLAAQRAAAIADSRRRRGSSSSGSEDGDRGEGGRRDTAGARLRSGAGAGTGVSRGWELPGGAAAGRAAAAPPAAAAAGGDGDDEDGEDEAFMRRYRAARVLQLRAGIGLPRYGDVVELEDRLELPDALDAVDPRVHALVLLWEPFLPAAQAARAAWPAVAAEHPHTRFFAMRSALASASFDTIGLPAVAVYRAGKLLDSLLRLQDLAGVARPGAEDLSALLARARVLDGPDAPPPALLPSPAAGGGGRGAAEDERSRGGFARDY